ncbi:MAG: AraC family transcriptional regulator [Spirochaetia bacterium]|nr:AraC family transcriptional regulator [Spirochaetia bacterium]MCF7946910.1 AraC family transcriptional regulator [Spirochaetia bacterium]MCF7953714.1 AraC family transcriptional regulator [Spirochaetales bacterium]
MRIKDVVFVYQMKSVQELRWHGRHHEHGGNDYELHYFLQGEGYFLNNAAKHVIQNGKLFLTEPHSEHAIIASSIKRPVSYYAVLFKLETDDDEIRELLRNKFHPVHGAIIGTSYRFFFEEIKEKGMSNKPYLQKSAVYQLLSFLYGSFSGNSQNFLGDETNHHIERALSIMQNNVFSYMNLEMLAKRLYLDKSYFIRLFKKKMQTTPMKYYMKLKIEAASSMLINTDLQIRLIAGKLSFSSEFHLSRVFKEYTGISPSNYRKQYIQTLGIPVKRE